MAAVFSTAAVESGIGKQDIGAFAEEIMAYAVLTAQPDRTGHLFAVFGVQNTLAGRRCESWCALTAAHPKKIDVLFFSSRHRASICSTALSLRTIDFCEAQVLT